MPGRIGMTGPAKKHPDKSAGVWSNGRAGRTRKVSAYWRTPSTDNVTSAVVAAGPKS